MNHNQTDRRLYIHIRVGSHEMNWLNTQNCMCFFNIINIDTISTYISLKPRLDDVIVTRSYDFNVICRDQQYA